MKPVYVIVAKFAWTETSHGAKQIIAMYAVEVEEAKMMGDLRNKLREKGLPFVTVCGWVDYEKATVMKAKEFLKTALT